MHRVSQADLVIVGRDRHQTRAFQRFEYLGRCRRFEVAEFNRFAQGERLDDLTRLVGEAADALLDQIEQAGSVR